MISTDGGIAAAPLPLEFNCFDPIDDDDIDESVGDTPIKATTLFDATSYGSDTFEKPDASKKKTKPAKNAKKRLVTAPLDEAISDQERVEFYTRPYEPTDFDKSSRPQWVSPVAANDNQKRKQSFPALDEARNNTLMVGRDRAATLTKNEWAFDILIEVKDLLDAAAPKCSWLQHNGHGQTDEHAIEDGANPGYGVDAKHDYGPSENKVKRMWQHGCNDNEPSKDGEPWKLGNGSEASTESKDGHLTDTIMTSSATGKPRWTRILHTVGALEFGQYGRAFFHDKKGKRLEFKTKTRGAKGPRWHPKVLPDPVDTHDYDGAALPRNKHGEMTAGFMAGKIGSKNSAAPYTLDFVPETGSSHSDDPWAAQLAADGARDEATIALSQHRLLVGDKAYDALTQAASGFRVGELCGGTLGNTTDSSRGRTLLQFAIERIIEDRSRTFWRSKTAA